MTELPFLLIPFLDANVPDITIKGRILRQNNLLTIHYALAGKIEDIFLPSPSVNPSRKDDLWKTTCLEFFLAVKNLPQYWEFNISPSRDWNVYYMDAYRRIGFRQEASIQWFDSEMQKSTNVFLLNAAVDLNPIIQVEQMLEVGVTAVIQTKEGSETYWALTHPAPEADFHLRQSFLLAMAE
jgi:hypothetical protein